LICLDFVILSRLHDITTSTVRKQSRLNYFRTVVCYEVSGMTNTHCFLYGIMWRVCWSETYCWRKTNVSQSFYLFAIL